MDILKIFLISSILGFIFYLFKLPIPAPPTIGGIIGIIGLYAGYKLGSLLFY